MLILNGMLYVFSLIFLSFVISFVFGYIQHDDSRKIVRDVLKRWSILLGGIFGLIVVFIIIFLAN